MAVALLSQGVDEQFFQADIHGLYISRVEGIDPFKGFGKAVTHDDGEYLPLGFHRDDFGNSADFFGKAIGKDCLDLSLVPAFSSSMDR